MIQLRDYQGDGFTKILMCYQAGYKRVLYQCPTGGGKTPLAVKLCQDIINKKLGVVWFIVHRIELINQLAEFLNSQGIQYSYIYGDEDYDPDSEVVLCSIQSIASKLKKNPEWTQPKLIVCDEAHRSISKSYLTMFDKFSKSRVLGLTATPKRLDGRPMRLVYDVLVLGPTIKDLIERGYLADPSLYVPPQTAQIIEDARSTWDTAMGDYDTKAMEQTFSGNGKIYGDVLAHYQKLNPNKEPTLVFCTSVKHARETAAYFTANGYPMASIDGTMDKAEIGSILRQLRDGALCGVCSCDLITEGLDIPCVVVYIGLRPTKSLTIWMQGVGRVMRPWPGKDKAIIIDHVNNSGLHGAPWINRRWTLDSYHRMEKAASDPNAVVNNSSLKLCLRCGNYMRTNLTQCVECGYIFKGRDKKRIVVPTELVEITVRTEMADRLETFDDFFAYGVNKGWSEDFCHKFATDKVQQKIAAKKTYAVGTRDELIALFLSEKKTQAQAEKKADEVLANRKNQGASDQNNLYQTGTFSQLKAYAIKTGKDNPEKFANGILKRAHQEVLDHGTEEQLREIGLKFYEVQPGNLQSFVSVKLAKRGNNVSSSSGSAGTKVGGSNGGSSTGKKESDRFERLVWYAKSGKMKTGIHPDPTKYARERILQESSTTLSSGGKAELEKLGSELHLTTEETKAFVDSVLDKRGVKVTA